MLDPLTIERMVAVSGDAPIVVALSGGGDSVALLRLLEGWFGAEKLRALVVDHALRDGSAADAERARDFAREQDINAEILTLQWPNGIKRGQAAARTVRYEALCERAHEIGARVIAVAHSADDQIETLLMRASSGSSWRGLAGMAAFSPAPVWPVGRELWLARPLLGQRREALRVYLRGIQADWIEDPANTNPAFERVRARAEVAAREAEGADVMRFAKLAARIRPHVERLDAAAAALIAKAARFEVVRITVSAADWQAPDQVRRRALSVLLTAASGAAREPASDAVERLDARMCDADFSGAALGGARVQKRGEHYRFERDPGALSGRADGVPALTPLLIEPNRPAVWDGRLELNLAEPGWSVVATPTGAELQRGEERQQLAPLIEQNRASWLLRRRVAHLLGEHN